MGRGIVQSVVTQQAITQIFGSILRPSIWPSQPPVYIVIKCVHLKMLSLLMSLDTIGGLRNTHNIENTHFPAYRFVYLTLLYSDLLAAVKSRMQKLSSGMWSCTECGYATNYYTALTNHIESKHIETDGFVCEFCQTFCPTRNALKSHKHRKHRAEKRGILSDWILWDIYTQ